jgi:hypothetical protein
MNPARDGGKRRKKWENSTKSGNVGMSVILIIRTGFTRINFHQGVHILQLILHKSQSRLKEIQHQ